MKQALLLLYKITLVRESVRACVHAYIHPEVQRRSIDLDFLVVILEQAGSNEDGITESICLHAANMLDGWFGTHKG